MDNLAIVSDNPVKIRACWNGDGVGADHPHRLAGLDSAALSEIRGIGKDLVARTGELSETGDARFATVRARSRPSVIRRARRIAR